MLDELEALTKQTAATFEELEDRWICGHRRAQAMIDDMRIAPIVSLDGLYAFLTKHNDEAFDRAVEKVYSDYEVKVQDIERKYATSA